MAYQIMKKYELVVLDQGSIVISFKYFYEVWNYIVKNPGNYNFLVEGKLTNIKDYAFDNMLVPAYRFK